MGERARILAVNLLSELEGQCADPALLGQLGELMRKPDEKGVDKLNDLYQKIISLPGRVDTAKKAIESMRHAITMEREAYGIENTPTPQPAQVYMPVQINNIRNLSDAELANLERLLARAQQDVIEAA